MSDVMNLVRAEMAVAYVDMVLKWPSPNRPNDVKHRHMMEQRLPHAMRLTEDDVEDEMWLMMEVADARLYELNERHWHGVKNGGLFENPAFFCAFADLVLENRFGNCDQLTAVAFNWLVSVHRAPCNVGVYGLYQERKHKWRGLHEFVVVGPNAADHRLVRLDDEGRMTRIWSTETVWCDPWRQVSFQIRGDWKHHVRMILRDRGQAIARHDPLHGYSVRCEAFSAGRLRARGAWMPAVPPWQG